MASTVVQLITLTILVSVVQSKSITSFQTRSRQDVGKDIYELAFSHGYQLETHKVTTEDGYVLSVHRIPHGKNNVGEPKKPPIFLMHGLLSCSADWINVGPEKSMAYKLADLGYDVWLGNARGNNESREHRTLNPDVDKHAYWNFTWHDTGNKDLPVVIDYILDLTHQEQLQYVGFSQGTTNFFVLTSTRPEYNAKIKLATLFAPVCEMRNNKNPVQKLFAPFHKLLYQVTKMGIYEFLPRSKLLEKIAVALCDDGKPSQEFCKMVLWFVSGYNRDQLDGGFIPVITTNTPAGANLMQLIHYQQIIKHGFRNFDYYSNSTNVEIYGTPEPPQYDLSKITAPVSMFYGANDWLVNPIDVQLTASKLPNVVNLKQVDHPQFAHLDFVYAIDILDLVFNPAIEIIQKHN